MGIRNITYAKDFVDVLVKWVFNQGIQALLRLSTVRYSHDAVTALGLEKAVEGNSRT